MSDLVVLNLTGITLSLLALILVLAPRQVPRKIRHGLAWLIMWQWKKFSRLSAIVYGWLWQNGNGH
jgi:hypothetical protein